MLSTSQQASPRLHDLSGRIQLSEPNYFAYGGFADICKGEWVDDALNGRQVNFANSFKVVSVVSLEFTQVAVKIMRMPSTSSETIEKMSSVSH